MSDLTIINSNGKQSKIKKPIAMYSICVCPLTSCCIIILNKSAESSLLCTHIPPTPDFVLTLRHFAKPKFAVNKQRDNDNEHKHKGSLSALNYLFDKVSN